MHKKTSSDTLRKAKVRVDSDNQLEGLTIIIETCNGSGSS